MYNPFQKSFRVIAILFALSACALTAFAGEDPSNIGVSDQKAGSLLVYPYYVSDLQTGADTRITISNVGIATGATQGVTIVHMLYLERTSCAQADEYICLTPNASKDLKASSFDPGNSGYIIAFAVDEAGLPTQANRLIGNAFIKDGAYVGNYGAEAFWKHSPGSLTPTDLKTDLALINFNGECGTGDYDRAPCSFAVEIQSPKNSVGQRLILAGLRGDVSGQISATAATFGGALRGGQQVGVGQIYNGKEKPFGSFVTFLPGGCMSIATITDTTPKIPFTLGVQVPSGDVATLRVDVTAAVGLFLTPNNSTAATANNIWSGIRTLHKTKTNTSGVYVPVFMPAC